MALVILLFLWICILIYVASEVDFDGKSILAHFIDGIPFFGD